MTRISVDNALSSQLDQATGPVVICDPNGRVLGRFTPEIPRPIIKPEDQCPYTEEELRQHREEARNDPEEKTLTEIWKELGRT